MTSNRNLKIATLISHAGIVVGFGHGILTMGILELLWFPCFSGGPVSFRPDAPLEARLSVVCLCSFLGQAGLLYSLFAKQGRGKRAGHLLGLLLLWGSIAFFYGRSGRGTECSFRHHHLPPLPGLHPDRFYNQAAAAAVQLGDRRIDLTLEEPMLLAGLTACPPADDGLPSGTGSENTKSWPHAKNSFRLCLQPGRLH